VHKGTAASARPRQRRRASRASRGVFSALSESPKSPVFPVVYRLCCVFVRAYAGVSDVVPTGYPPISLKKQACESVSPTSLCRPRPVSYFFNSTVPGIGMISPGFRRAEAQQAEHRSLHFRGLRSSARSYSARHYSSSQSRHPDEDTKWKRCWGRERDCL